MKLFFVIGSFVLLTSCSNGRSLEEVEGLAVEGYNKAEQCESKIEDLESRIDDLESRLNM